MPRTRVSPFYRPFPPGIQRDSKQTLPESTAGLQTQKSELKKRAQDMLHQNMILGPQDYFELQTSKKQQAKEEFSTFPL